MQCTSSYALRVCLFISSQGSDPRHQHVFGVQLVRGRPFYGFCEAERVFVKITLYNPRHVSKVAALLQVREDLTKTSKDN